MGFNQIGIQKQELLDIDNPPNSFEFGGFYGCRAKTRTCGLPAKRYD